MPAAQQIGYGAGTGVRRAPNVSTSMGIPGRPMRMNVGGLPMPDVGGGGGYGGGHGGYGGNEVLRPAFSMGEHQNMKYDKYANGGRGDWVPVVIDAAPGDAPSLMAPGGYGMGQVKPIGDPLAGVGGTKPRLAYGGSAPHTAIVGDPQADGGPNPELVTSASPIHVTPLRGGKMPRVPKLAYGSEAAVEYPVYENYAKNKAELDAVAAAGTGTKPMYPEGVGAAGFQSPAAEEEEPVIQSPTSASSTISEDVNFMQPTTYSGDEYASDVMAEEEVPSEPVIAPQQGSAFTSGQDIRRAGFVDGAPPNQNLPQPPVPVQQIAEKDMPPNVFGEMKGMENPYRREREMRRFVKSNPMAVPRMEMEMRAAAEKHNADAQKFNVEQLEKHADNIRQIAHDVASERHQDDMVAGKGIVEAAKAKEAWDKEHQKRMEDANLKADIAGMVQNRLRSLGANTEANAPQRKALSEIMNSKTTKGMELRFKAYEADHPAAPAEVDVGGKKFLQSKTGALHPVTTPKENTWTPEKSSSELLKLQEIKNDKTKYKKLSPTEQDALWDQIKFHMRNIQESMGTPAPSGTNNVLDATKPK